MPKIVDLREDRKLICTNFDGYKLSLDKVPIIRHDLKTPTFRASPSDEQYSFLHAELFSLQNLLIPDPWERSSSYFVNNQREVMKSSYDENTGRPNTPSSVYRIPSANDRVPGDYNYSLKFVSEKIAILCDGIKELYILDTGDRVKSAEWKKLHICSISNELRGFSLFDSRLDIIHEAKIINCALVRIARDEVSHSLNVHWVTLRPDGDSWSLTVEDVIEGKGSLYYCAFEPKANALIVSSNRPLKFQSKAKEGAEHSVEEKEPEIVNYSWSQTDGHVILKFDEIEAKNNDDFSVTCNENRLLVNCNEKTLFDGVLFSTIDENLTSALSIEDNSLQIKLLKKNAELWPHLLCSGGGPTETTDGNKPALPFDDKPIPNLEAPIEECDFPMGMTDKEVKIDRLSLETKESTHQILLGSCPPLFSTILRPGFPAAIATRQDVDTSLWLQHYNPTNPSEWGFRHEGNLHAFGYVQASKQQKKFMDCAPDLSYAIICESHRHVFLYKSKNEGADGLRKRGGVQVNLGKQFLITLEDTGEVLGLATDKSVVTLLTEKCILYFQIN